VTLIEQAFWHPVADSASVTAQPSAVRLLGHDLVLWRDAAGVAVAFADQCPHRGARLSLGRVVNGQLECPYHGWRFGSDGRVAAVPALPHWQPPISHRAQRFELLEKYQLLWVQMARSPTAPSAPPAFAAEQDAALRKVNCGPYDVATSAPRIVENFLDMAHFGYVHDQWLGERGRPEIPDYTVQTTADGFIATQCLAWQPRSSINAQGGAMVEYIYEVNAPYAALLIKVPDQSSVAIAQFRESIALFVCPIEPERSRVWFRLAMNDFESSEQTMRQFQDSIFSQDKPVLESQRPRCLPLSAHAELHSAADKASAAYRRYLRELGICFGVLA
jgi:phenylpropionate dioxygenase-like ring-hydroxylating dioxygenase large terminal subunit